MYLVRRWSTRNAGMLTRLYDVLEVVLVRLHPLIAWLGPKRLEWLFVTVERSAKGLLFDCQMCGRCVLGSTGMTCPMNCPKSMRNGPCGGVRQNGHCEIRPEMPCVWVEAVKGNRMIGDGRRILVLRPPVDQRQRGSSSWLREVRLKLGEKDIVP